MNSDLVLLPGLNNTAAVFDRMLPHLSQGCTPLAIDHPALPTVEAIASAVLPRLPARFWLAGFSFGGYVALALLESVPERIEGLALICTAPAADANRPARSDRLRR